jgi:hypothetical protein
MRFKSSSLIHQRLILLEQDIGFVVAVKTPVVLVEATQRHNLSVVDFYSLHMQIFERLLFYHRTLLVKPRKQVTIQKRLIAGLISIPCCYDFHLNSAFLHRFD